jgi:hypothetical protein
VTAPDAVFREAAAEHQPESVPLSHLSIDLGCPDLGVVGAEPDVLRRHFAAVAPWVEAAGRVYRERLPGTAARISTCVLVDDYFGRPPGSAATVIRDLTAAADRSGLVIDYLARRSGCVDADGVPVARLVEGRLVADPPPGTNGSRPPAAETGWLCNGQRSPSGAHVEAMSDSRGWWPPMENAANRHSVFVDVELWDENRGRRTWSAAFLAAVWQLLRLGMLRNMRESVAVPRPRLGEIPADWDRLPAITQLNPAAAPFGADRTLAILRPGALAVEHAVRTILDQVAVEPGVLAQALDQAAGEGLELPPELGARIDHLFVGQ